MRAFSARPVVASTTLVVLALGGVFATAAGGAPAQAPSASPAAVHAIGTANVRRLARTQVPKANPRFTPAQAQFAAREAAHAEGRAAPRSSLQVPVVPGFPVTAAEEQRGFEGLSHRDQAFASGVELEPPDQGLCGGTVGATTFLFESVNLAIALYDTDATQYTPAIDLSAFYGLPPAFDPATGRFGPFLSDPKCYFDPDTRHWFHTVLEIGVNPLTGAFGTTAATLVAVSATDDPRGDYHLYSIDATHAGGPHCPCFGDQPLLGADANGLYIGTSEYSLAENFANGAQLYALDKRALEAGRIGTPVHIATGTTRTASVQPATTPAGRYETARNGTEYFMSGFDCLPPDCRVNPGLGNQITVWALTNTASLRTSSPHVQLSSTTIESEVYGQPVPQTQRPGVLPLGRAVGEPLPQVEPNDTRMNQVVYADGRLWSGLNTVIAPGPRDGIAWFAVRPSVESPAVRARIARQGYVAARDAFVSFPSIGVDDAGRGVVAYSLMGPAYYPSAAWTAISGRGTAPSVKVARSGFRPEDGFTCYPEFYPPGTTDALCRWGDYSASFALPNGEVWSAAELIGDGARTPFANWGTFLWPVNR
jgi:hypothetical protein